MSFFRYPGGKSKLQKQILECLSSHINFCNEYREPFFGGGSIGLKFLEAHPQIKKIWINDKDPGIAALWTSVIRYPHVLKQKISNFTPSTDAFYTFKKELIDLNEMPSAENEIVELGFKKIAIHQISYSGLGTKSGGPLGGQRQESNYKIDCRWSTKYMCKKIDNLHQQLNKFEIYDNACTCLDFSVLLNNNENISIIYLDPPYYEEGNNLYQCGFTVEDHNRLATMLKNLKHKWILSYDACNVIMSLYSWASRKVINVNYSITATKGDGDKRLSRTKEEYLIY